MWVLADDFYFLEGVWKCVQKVLVEASVFFLSLPYNKAEMQ